MKRGEIWTAAGPGCLSKPRPVVVLQSDVFAETDSVTVCPITSQATAGDADLVRVELPAGDTTGLQQTSWAMVDKIITTRRTSLTQRVGTTPTAQLRRASMLMAVFLGLAE